MLCLVTPLCSDNPDNQWSYLCTTFDPDTSSSELTTTVTNELKQSILDGTPEGGFFSEDLTENNRILMALLRTIENGELEFREITAYRLPYEFTDNRYLYRAKQLVQPEEERTVEVTPLTPAFTPEPAMHFANAVNLAVSPPSFSTLDEALSHRETVLTYLQSLDSAIAPMIDNEEQRLLQQLESLRQKRSTLFGNQNRTTGSQPVQGVQNQKPLLRSFGTVAELHTVSARSD